MNEYQRLCALLKVAYENLWTLHHNLSGDDAWKGNHEWLGELYARCEDQADELIELGLQLGFKEPSIAESLLSYPAIATDNRSWPDSQRITLDLIAQLMAQLVKAEADVPADVKNKLQEFETVWRLEAYKMSRAMGKERQIEPRDEDDE